MASPRLEAFAVYNLTTGAPLTGQAGLMAFLTYKNDLGADLSQPTITEIGGGWYSFLPVFSNPARGIVYTINCGSNANPAKTGRFMRPEDWHSDYVTTVQDMVQDLTDYEQGNWQIVTTGPNANHFVVYDTDGTTVLKKYLLKDQSGNPTSATPFKREAD